MLDGRIIGACMPRHRHQEFLKFLEQVNRETAPDLDLHLIIDNYCTHKHLRHEACVANLRTRWSRSRSGDVRTSPEANLAGGGQGGRSRLKPRGIRGAWSLSH